MSSPSPNERTAQVTLVAGDYTAALRLVALSSWKRPIPLIVIGVFAAAFLAMIVTGPDNNPERTSIGIGALVGLFLLPFIVYFLILPLRARTIYKQQKSMQEPATISWDEAGYTARNAHVGGTMPWSQYFDWLENDRVIIIRQSPALFQMLPKSAITPGQAADIRACAHAAGLRGA